ncbi:hypothetical protein KCP74_24470 [Salmonella enterica subsp. enterica]|nr:hypothetical protein KCP74_24470 [Salmonella enterica subsp. enterica]
MTARACLRGGRAVNAISRGFAAGSVTAGVVTMTTIHPQWRWVRPLVAVAGGYDIIVLPADWAPGCFRVDRCWSRTVEPVSHRSGRIVARDAPPSRYGARCRTISSYQRMMRFSGAEDGSPPGTVGVWLVGCAKGKIINRPDGYAAIDFGEII